MKRKIILRINNLSKSFGGKQINKNINLSVMAGEMLVVVGPSGCGKTTLLRSIAGLEKPDTGSIRLGERVLFNADSPQTNLEPHQRQIGIVFQNYALWPHKNIFRNVAYPLQMQRVPKEKQHSEVAGILRQVHMSGFENRYPHQLSSGEQQRIALARALVMNPKLLLLDEPLSNLDAHLRDEMGYEIKRIQQEMGITVIHVTHDQTEALKLASRISVMDQGEIIQTDSAKQVYQHPKDKFVAGFIGTTNLIECPILIRNKLSFACLPDGSTFKIGNNGKVPAKPVTLAIRPEDITIDHSGNAKPGEILDIVYQGNLLWYRLIYAGVEITVQSNVNADFNIGDKVWINVQRAIIIR